MSAQHGRGVEVVTVRPEVLSVLTRVDEERGTPAPAYMVRGHKKGVKILESEHFETCVMISLDFLKNLVCGDNWGKGFVKRKGRLTKCAPIPLGQIRSFGGSQNIGSLNYDISWQPAPSSQV